MIRTRLAVMIATSLVLVAGCADPQGDADPVQPDDPSDDAADDGVADPDDPVATDEGMDGMSHDEPIDARDEPFTLVEPTPGMDDRRTVQWESVVELDEPRIRLLYWTGVEPCHVLDSVEVEETSHAITVTLWEGSEPQEGQPHLCEEISRYTAVDVTLDAPVDGRRVLDGATVPEH